MFDPRLKGHLPIRRRLQERLAAGTLPGSLLFVGSEAIGKRRVALELAQRELCFRGSACGVCEGCRMFTADPLPQELPNLLRIAPEGKAGLIRIGVIREDDLVEGGVITWAHQAPPPGCHRWILVEDAHRLHGASANMLLKTLEEPPPSTHFLMVTHRPEAMLQTIRSRCERVAFSPLEATQAWAIAEEHGWDEQDQPRWSALSGGTLRYLDPGTFSRACDQVDAWLGCLSGTTEGWGALLPDRQSERAQSEQMMAALEILVAVLSEVSRAQVDRPLRFTPWSEAIRAAADRGPDLRAIQDVAFRLSRHLGRNPLAEVALREVMAACG